MNDQTAAPEAAAAVTKTLIRPNLSRYVRAKSGAGKRSHRIDDFTARTLDGKTLESIKEGAVLLGIDVAKWAHLNPGQQRMLVGNAIRNRLNAKKDPLEESAVTNVFGEPSAPYDAEAAAAAKAAADAEKAAKKAAKEAEKAAKAAEKAAAAGGAVESSGDEASGTAEAPEGKSHRYGGKSKKSK